MKLVLEKDGIKREIAAPFSLCGGKADFVALIEQLQRFVDSEASYGWVNIWPLTVQLGNSPALGWAEKEEAPLPGSAASEKPWPYKRPVCRGSLTLGTACGTCERCQEHRAAKTQEGT